MTMAERPDTGHTEGCMSDMPLSMCQCDTPGWEPEGRYIDAETLDEIIYPPGSCFHFGAPTALTESRVRAKAERIARLHANEYEYKVKP